MSPPGDGVYSLQWTSIQRFNNFGQHNPKQWSHNVKQIRKHTAAQKPILLVKQKRSAPTFHEECRGERTLYLETEHEKGNIPLSHPMAPGPGPWRSTPPHGIPTGVRAGNGFLVDGTSCQTHLHTPMNGHCII